MWMYFCSRSGSKIEGPNGVNRRKSAPRVTRTTPIWPQQRAVQLRRSWRPLYQIHFRYHSVYENRSTRSPSVTRPTYCLLDTSLPRHTITGAAHPCCPPPWGCIRPPARFKRCSPTSPPLSGRNCRNQSSVHRHPCRRGRAQPPASHPKSTEGARASRHFG